MTGWIVAAAALGFIGGVITPVGIVWYCYRRYLR